MIGSADEFRRLRESEEPAEYHRAAHEAAADDVWLEVIARFPDMRTWVAHNKTVPLAILEVLACDADPDVRGSVAMKRKLSAELFEKLAADEDARVRHAIVRNGKIPRHLLVRLASDPEPMVARSANARLPELGV